jgi:hypothetical protein
MHFLQRFKKNEGNPLGTERMLVVLIGLIAVIGAIALLVAPVSAADIPIVASIPASLNMTVTANNSLSNWQLVKHQENLIMNAFTVNLESDYPSVQIKVNETGGHGGYLWNATRGILSMPLHVGAPTLDMGSITLDTVLDAQSPFTKSYPLSQFLNGDKSGSYSGKLTVTAIIG